MWNVGDQIGGREVVQVLAPDRTWLAREPGGRLVVIKRLEDDCLLGGKLHPAIKLRLERIRELPVKRVANLHGVEVIDGMPALVWDYVPGSSIKAEADGADRLARKLVLAVQALHLAGIVHGRVHEGNIILDESGNVWLIDISPLLWTDEQDDVQEVAALLERTLERPLKVNAQTTLDGVLEQIEAAPGAAARDERQTDTERATSLALAALVVLIGIAVALGTQRLLSKQVSDAPATAGAGG